MALLTKGDLLRRLVLFSPTIFHASQIPPFITHCVPGYRSFSHWLCKSLEVPISILYTSCPVCPHHLQHQREYITRQLYL